MNRLIALTDKGKGHQGYEQLSGRHAQVVDKLATLQGKVGGAVAVPELRKACRTLKPKRLRAIVRQLIAAKFVSVRKVTA